MGEDDELTKAKLALFKAVAAQDKAAVDKVTREILRIKDIANDRKVLLHGEDGLEVYE